MAQKRSLNLKIPIKAISTNKLYSGQKRRSYHYKKYRKEVFKFLKDNYNEGVCLKGNLKLEMEVGFSSPLSDLSNSIKGIEDCISAFYFFNDRQIVEIKMSKFRVDKGDEFVNLKIKQTRKDIDRRVSNGWE